MKKTDAPKQDSNKPNIERFKYEVAQEMGLSSRSKSVNKIKKTEQLGSDTRSTSTTRP